MGKRIINIRNYKRKVLAVLLATEISFAVTGCCNDSHSELIQDLETQIKTLEAQKIEVRNRNNELSSTCIALLEKDNVLANELNEVKTDIVTGKESYDILDLEMKPYTVSEDKIEYTRVEDVDLTKTYCKDAKHNEQIVSLLNEKWILDSGINALNYQNQKYEQLIKEFQTNINEMEYIFTHQINPYKRSKRIKNASDPFLEMLFVYATIDEEFTAENGNNYRVVSVLNDREKGHEIGLFNMTTLEEEIPCGVYNSTVGISEDSIFKKESGKIKIYNYR